VDRLRHGPAGLRPRCDDDGARRMRERTRDRLGSMERRPIATGPASRSPR
jgi:hypothetical protein